MASSTKVPAAPPDGSLQSGEPDGAGRGYSRVAAWALIAAMAVGSVFLWLGIPLLWLLLGSQLQDGSQPQMGPYVLIIVGIIVSVIIVAKGLGKLNRLYGHVTHNEPTVRVVLPWHRSMRGERETGQPRSMLDVVMVCSVSVAMLCFGVWFFFLADSPFT